MSKAILSIDGGGMKGIIPAVILKQLEQYVQTFSCDSNARIGEYFDLIAGTSTGSILTGLYLFPDTNNRPKYSAAQILDFYLTMGENIFEKQHLYPLFGSKYTNKGFISILKEYFGNITIDKLIKPCLMVSYDTTKNSAEFFNSSSAIKDPSRNHFVRDLVLASCSAPTFFPPACLSKPDCPSCYIDGGVVANNPALCALIETMKYDGCQNISDIHLLSLGNIDKYSCYPYYSVKKWGLLEWAIPLFGIFKNSNEQTVHYQLQMLFQSIQKENNYIRIEASSKNKIPAMDDISKEAASYLLETGQILAQAYENELTKFAKWLISHKKEQQ